MSIITGTYSVCSLGCRSAEDCDNSCVGRKRKPTAPAPADMRKPEDGGTVTIGVETVTEFLYDAARGTIADLEQRLAERDATIAERDRRIADLEAGLEPFAKHASHFDKPRRRSMSGKREDTAMVPIPVFIHQVRRARALPSGQQDTGGSE